jgi:2,6-dihydroxypseudooxynicotine hydrolase
MTSTDRELVRDERVAVAVSHWSPRFVAQGVDLSDFNRTVERIARWSDWCQEWGRTAQEYEVAADAAEAAGRSLTAAEAWRRAGLCWHFGKFVFMEDDAQLRAASDRTVSCYQRGLWALEPPGERVEVPYDGIRLPGLLRRPAGSGRPPIVIMIPGLDSVKEELQTTADYFLRRGMATLAIDGPGQGETEFVRNIEPAYERPVTSVVDWLAQRSDFDVERLGVFGVSLGGYYAVRAAAFEPRIRAAIDHAGTFSLAANWPNRSAISRAAFQKRSGAASDAEAQERAKSIDLTGVAERVECPLLVVHGKLDPISPASDAERVAGAARRAELVVFEDGNHGLTNRVFESRSLMADWMAERLQTA